jgi:hypothetical protein
MLIFNIAITESGHVEFGDLSDIVKAGIVAARNTYPSLEYALFDDVQAQAAIARGFPPKVLRSYRRLSPFSYKADLARYCLLYLHGGIYFDLSYHMVRPFSELGSRPVVFRDFMNSSPWDTSNGLIYMPPRSRAMWWIIAAVCRNVDHEYYGKNPLCPTGPALFGKALAKFYNPEDIICGMAAWVPASNLREVPVLQLMDKEINPVHCQILGNNLVAIKIKRGGAGLECIGVDGGNNYNDLWRARKIYGGGYSLGNTLRKLL